MKHMSRLCTVLVWRLPPCPWARTSCHAATLSLCPSVLCLRPTGLHPWQRALSRPQAALRYWQRCPIVLLCGLGLSAIRLRQWAPSLLPSAHRPWQWTPSQLPNGHGISAVHPWRSALSCWLSPPLIPWTSALQCRSPGPCATMVPAAVISSCPAVLSLQPAVLSPCPSALIFIRVLRQTTTLTTLLGPLTTQLNCIACRIPPPVVH
jgi:hypothetical protein